MRTLLIALAATATAASAQTYTLTSFGRPCPGTLQGQVVTTPQGRALRLAVSGAAADELALLVLGHQAATPHPLPNTNCLLLVDPRATMLSMTDAAGNASFATRLPPIVPITIDFQAGTVDFTRVGRAVETTNGIRLVGV